MATNDITGDVITSGNRKENLGVVQDNMGKIFGGKWEERKAKRAKASEEARLEKERIIRELAEK